MSDPQDPNQTPPPFPPPSSQPDEGQSWEAPSQHGEPSPSQWQAPDAPPPPSVPEQYPGQQPGQFGGPPAPPPPGAGQQPPQPPAPGGFGAPPPPAPGGYGAPPPPGAYGQQQYGQQPGQFGNPPPPGGFGGPPPPGQFQQPAQPYYYGQGSSGTHTLATGGKRILARIIDMLLMYAVLGGIIVVAIFAILGSDSTVDSSGDFSSADSFLTGSLIVVTLILAVVSIFYEVAFIAIKGATPGKMIMKIQVVRMADGQIPGWGVSFMRWVLNLINLVPSLGGCVLIVLNIWGLINLFNHPMRQTPFDMIAKTVVIDKQ